MAKKLNLILVSLLLIVAIASSSSDNRSDGIAGTSIFVGLLGLLTSFVIGRAGFSPVAFLCCGLILGFSIAAGLSLSDNSTVVFFSTWTIYTALFVAVGKRSSVSFVAARTD